MSVDQVPEPEPGAGEVAVRSQAAGICGSEIEGYLGRMSNRRPPLIMGHEFAGTVEELGDAVDERWRGRRVAVNPIVGCGRCSYCERGERNLCPDRYLLGIGRPGGFASAAAVPERCLFELPETMDLRLGALVEPLANGVHCVRRALAGVERPPSAVVIGAGTIGLACMQAALESGIPAVTAVERHPARREHARRLGATAAVESTSQAEPGAALVIDAVGAAETRAAAVELAGPGGTCAFIGLHEDETALGWHRVIRSNVRIQGAFGYSDEDFRTALDWLAQGRAGIGELPPVLPLERGPDAFAELARGPIDQIKVFLAG
jgi:threonine dehydrogenase-like Zn-dependent dehydrogenase